MGEALCHCFHKCKEVLEIVWSLYNKVISFGFSNGNCACIAHFLPAYAFNCMFVLNKYAWVINAFILSRLVYSLSLYFGISQALLSHLQLVHYNSLLLTGTCKGDHISPSLGSFTLASSTFMNWRFYLLFLSL